MAASSASDGHVLVASVRDIINAIATGHQFCPVIAWADSEEENEKRLGSMLISGVPVISLDNAETDIGGAMLCQVTERPVVRVRILGRSETPEFDCRAAVFATGNNIAIRGDMTRRALTCNLDAAIEQPELRNFEDRPLERVHADRGRFVAAALIVVRAYLRAGAPDVYSQLGSYGLWSRMVRGPLIWLGQPDPAESMEAARAEDPELNSITNQSLI
jgi:hypothetical protein